MALPTFGVTGTAVAAKPAPAGYCPWRSEAAIPRIGTRVRSELEEKLAGILKRLPNRSALDGKRADRTLARDLRARCGNMNAIKKGDMFTCGGVKYKVREIILHSNGTEYLMDEKDGMWAIDECDLLGKERP